MKFYSILFFCFSCISKNEKIDIYIPEKISWILKKTSGDLFPKRLQYCDYMTVVKYKDQYYIFSSYNMRVDNDSIVFGTEPDIIFNKVNSNKIVLIDSGLFFKNKKYVKSDKYFKNSIYRMKEYL